MDLRWDVDKHTLSNFTGNDFGNRLNYLILNNCFNGFYFKWASAADYQEVETLMLLQDGKICD